MNLKENCYLLTDYGTIISKIGDDNKTISKREEYSINEFERFCKKNKQHRVTKLQLVQDDENEKLPYFYIYLTNYDEFSYEVCSERTIYLFLSPSRVENLKKGIIDSDLERLIKLSEIKDIECQKKEINRKVKTTGQFPNDVYEIDLYRDFLCEQKNENFSSIIKFLFPSLLMTCIPSGILINEMLIDNLFSLQCILILGSLSVCGLGFGSFFAFSTIFKKLDDKEFITSIKYYSKKIKALSKHRKKIEQDEIVNLYQRYRDETNRVGTLIQQLTEEEKEVYKKVFIDLVVDYCVILNDKLANYESSFYSQIRDWNKVEYQKMFLLGIEVQKRLDETNMNNKKISCSLDEIVPESGITYLKTI